MKRFFSMIGPLFTPPDDQGAEGNESFFDDEPSYGGASDEFDALMDQYDEADPDSLQKRVAARQEEMGIEHDEGGDPQDESPADESGDDAGEEGRDTTAIPDLTDLLPEGAVVETIDDLRTHISLMADSHKALSLFNDLVEGDAALKSYLEMRQAGKDSRFAASEAFSSLVEAPDPDLDPEGYADWVSERKLADAERKRSEQADSEKNDLLKSIADQAHKALAATVQKYGLDDDQADVLASKFRSIARGDLQTGKFPKDAFDVIYNGMAFEQTKSGVDAVVKAVESGRISTIKPDKSDSPTVAALKAAVVKAYAAGGKNAGRKTEQRFEIPEFDGGGGNPDMTESERERAELASTVRPRKSWAD